MVVSGSYEFLEELFNFLLDFGNGIVGRSKTGNRNTVLVDNELGEVPFDGTAKKALKLSRCTLYYSQPDYLLY